MSAEGLDINRCNFVLCFDPPKTFQQYIQSKGRVRVEYGLFYVLVEDDEVQERTYVQQKFLQFCDIEKIFTKLVPLANQIKIESRNSGSKFGGKFDFNTTFTTLKQSSEELNTYNTPSSASNTGVSLSLENAISILNRYCLKLPSDTFTKLAPHYYLDEVRINSESDNNSFNQRFQCRLYLPINSTFRDEICGAPMTNPMMAKRSAAFKAVKTLQELGELDNNYYPVGKETNRYIEKLGLQECFITTSSSTSNTATAAGAAVPTSVISVATGTGTHNYHHHQQQQQNQKSGNRYNRLQARNIASKRRQYYFKKVATYLSIGECFPPDPTIDDYYRIENLYEFDLKITCPLPEEQNTRGRPLVDPATTSRTFGIIVPSNLPSICDFTIYNRSGEVTVSLKRLSGATDCTNNNIITLDRVEMLKSFHYYTIENVLKLGKSSLIHQFGPKASNGNYVIVPINDITIKNNNDQSISSQHFRGIDFDFVELITRYQADGSYKDSFTITSSSSSNLFEFHPELYYDSVVIPKYRRDKTQSFFYVAEICLDLTPLSPFPDHGFATFEEYYHEKYGLTITNLKQPLLDVDHTSSRLNMLTPR